MRGERRSVGEWEEDADGVGVEKGGEGERKEWGKEGKRNRGMHAGMSHCIYPAGRPRGWGDIRFRYCVVYVCQIQCSVTRNKSDISLR